MTQHRLVIAEKPSVALSLAAVLGAKQRHDGYLSGNGCIVSWCFGHLAELADADVYDEKYAKWRYDDLPILPASWRYTLRADKSKQFELLRDLMSREDVSEVVNACDAGREGELIFRTVYYMAGCTKTMKRLWISSMETRPSERALQTFVRDGNTTGCTSPPFAAPARTGWWASTPQGSFRCCTTAPSTWGAS